MKVIVPGAAGTSLTTKLTVVEEEDGAEQVPEDFIMTE
jgi:hypothetical protein